MGRLGLLFGGITTSMALGGPAAADGKTAALVIMQRGEVNAEIVAATRSALEDVVVIGVTVRRGEILADKLEQDPTEAVLKCEADLACLAEVGADAAADELIMVRIIPGDAKGARIQVLVLGSKTKTIERRLQFTVAAQDDITTVVLGCAAEIFGAPVKAAEQEDLLIIGAAESDDTLAAFTEIADGEAEPQGAASGRIATAERDPTTTSESDVPDTQNAAVPWWKTPRLPTFAGAAVATIGVAALIAGGAFEAKAKGKRDEANEAISQLTAARLQQEGQRAASSANAAYTVSIVTLITGVIVVGLDLAGLLGGEPISRLGSSETSAGMQWHW